MVVIKEIKKLGPKIKEIKKEDSSSASLEDELNEADTEQFAGIIRGRRQNSSAPSLSQSDVAQERAVSDGERPTRATENSADSNSVRASYSASAGGNSIYVIT